MSPAASDSAPSLRGPGIEAGPTLPVGRARRWREAGVFAALLLLGQVFFFHRPLWSGLRETSGDYLNHMLVNYILEHSFLWLTGAPAHASLWDPPVYHPVPNVLAYAESLLGVAPLYWPLRLAGLPPDTAYQIWVMLLPALSFAAAYLLFRSGLGFPPLPAAAGAFLCAYGANVAAQINNPQLHSLFFSYFAGFCLCRIFQANRPRPVWVALCFASLAAQLYAGFYLGWLAAFFLGLAALGMLALPALRPRLLRTVRANLLPALLAGILAGLLLLPLAGRYRAVVHEMGWSNQLRAAPTLPQPLSWFYPGRRSLAYFWLGRTGLFDGLPVEPEQRLALGLATLVCAALGLWQGRKNPWLRLAAILAIAWVLLLTEWPGGGSLWYAVQAVVPGARAVRFVTRAGIVLLFPVAVGVAAFFTARPRTPAMLALLGLCLAEQAYSEIPFSKPMERADVGRFAAAVDPACPSFYMMVKPAAGEGSPPWIYQVEIMMAQAATGVPTLNGGYTRFDPPGYGSLSRNVIRGPEDEERIARDLAAWQSRYHLPPGGVCPILVTVPTK